MLASSRSEKPGVMSISRSRLRTWSRASSRKRKVKKTWSWVTSRVIRPPSDSIRSSMSAPERNRVPRRKRCAAPVARPGRFSGERTSPASRISWRHMSGAPIQGTAAIRSPLGRAADSMAGRRRTGRGSGGGGSLAELLLGRRRRGRGGAEEEDETDSSHFVRMFQRREFSVVKKRLAMPMTSPGVTARYLSSSRPIISKLGNVNQASTRKSPRSRVLEMRR